MFSKNGFFGKVGDIAKKAVDMNQRLTEEITERQVRKVSADTRGHAVYEAFVPSYGAGKKFVITENSLIISGNEYLYSQIGTISLMNPPTSFTDGVAQVVIDGKAVNLAYNVGQSDRFIKAMDYANEQIDKAHGITRKYKYMLNFGAATKIEVYEDYMILYQLQAGVTAIVKNSFAGGANGKVLSFSDISVELQNVVDSRCMFVITAGQNVLQLPIADEDYGIAEEIVAYIKNAKEMAKSAVPEYTDEEWEKITGTACEFPLGDKILVVKEDLDAFNSYRKKFRELADSFRNLAKEEYDKSVTNLNTYLQLTPKIYLKYLDVLAAKAMDIFVAEGIWTSSKDSFLAKHVRSYHLTDDYLKSTVESVKLTSENNMRSMAKLTSHIPNVIGGGFGTKGAVKGIAKAEAFNFVRDSVEDELLKGAQQLNPAQQAELYGRVNPTELFQRIYQDYWSVFLTVVKELRDNKKNIAWPKQTEKDKNIFQNMSNPNFPQDKKSEMFIDLISNFPYSKDYMRYMTEQYGDNEQTVAIREYFGYKE